MWVHYYDPHDPYVSSRGGHFSGFAEAAYVEELHRADRGVADLIDAIDRLGMAAVIVVSSDHGESFGEHHDTHHGNSVYEELLRVPLLVVPLHGATLPTLLPRQKRRPRCVLRCARRRARISAATTPTEPGWLRWSLSDGVSKVILDSTTGRVELYDLASDPGELVDVALGRSERTRALLSGLAAAP